MFQIDAFTGRVFGGNPAAVCPLERWLDDATLQAIALENNLSATAFFIEDGDAFGLRWFTPAMEVDLCGHGTLATAHVLFNEIDVGGDRLDFDTRSGRLSVRRDGDRLALDFPAIPSAPSDDIDALADALGTRPEASRRNDKHVAVFVSEAEVRGLAPDFAKLAALPFGGVSATPPEIGRSHG